MKLKTTTIEDSAKRDGAMLLDDEDNVEENWSDNVNICQVHETIYREFSKGLKRTKKCLMTTSEPLSRLVITLTSILTQSHPFDHHTESFRRIVNMKESYT